ncbi:class I SAM-dependent methyltransferase [Alphaproteobacteria bacterium LSUCC0684]
MNHENQNRDEAYSLSTPEEHRLYYDRWAETYEADFAIAEGYVYPERIARLLASLLPDGDGRIADIGCGTGLIGQHLRDLGVTSPIDGLDISQGMLDVAASKDVYAALHLADLTDPSTLPERRYRALISAGTFTLGHLGPDALIHALGLAEPGGLALIGINAQHFEEKGFAATLTSLKEDGVITAPVLHSIGIYADPDAVTASSTTATVAEFTFLKGA